MCVQVCFHRRINTTPGGTPELEGWSDTRWAGVLWRVAELDTVLPGVRCYTLLSDNSRTGVQYHLGQSAPLAVLTLQDYSSSWDGTRLWHAASLCYQARGVLSHLRGEVPALYGASMRPIQRIAENNLKYTEEMITGSHKRPSGPGWHIKAGPRPMGPPRYATSARHQ